MLTWVNVSRATQVSPRSTNCSSTHINYYTYYCYLLVKIHNFIKIGMGDGEGWMSNHFCIGAVWRISPPMLRYQLEKLLPDLTCLFSSSVKLNKVVVSSSWHPTEEKVIIKLTILKNVKTFLTCKLCKTIFKIFVCHLFWLIIVYSCDMKRPNFTLTFKVGWEGSQIYLNFISRHVSQLELFTNEELWTWATSCGAFSIKKCKFL